MSEASGHRPRSSSPGARMDPAFAQLFAKLFDVVKTEESFVDSVMTEKARASMSSGSSKKRRARKGTKKQRNAARFASCSVPGSSSGAATPSRSFPALIRNIGTPRSTITANGGMVWDPVACMWRGNDDDLKRFRTPMPALIRAAGPPQLAGPAPLAPPGMPVGPGSMVFDPVTLRWQGNEDEEDVFEGIACDEADDAAAIQKDFLVLGSHTRAFHRSEADHDAQLAGWMRHCDISTNRSFHANVIRTMAIEKVLSDLTAAPAAAAAATAAAPAATEENKSAAAMPVIALTPVEPKKQVEDLSMDFGDLPDTLIVTPRRNAAAADADLPFDAVLDTASAPVTSRAHRNSSGNLSTLSPRPVRANLRGSTGLQTVQQHQAKKPSSLGSLAIADLPMDDLEAAIPEGEDLAQRMTKRSASILPSPEMDYPFEDFDDSPVPIVGTTGSAPRTPVKPAPAFEQAPQASASPPTAEVKILDAVGSFVPMEEDEEKGFTEEEEEEEEQEQEEGEDEEHDPNSDEDGSSSDGSFVDHSSEEDPDLEGVLFGKINGELRPRTLSSSYDEDVSGLQITEGSPLVLRLRGKTNSGSSSSAAASPSGARTSDLSGIVFTGDMNLASAIARKKGADDSVQK